MRRKRLVRPASILAAAVLVTALVQLAGTRAEEPEALDWSAADVVREVRLGRGIEVDDSIPEAMRTSVFMTTDVIYLSIKLAPEASGDNVNLNIVRNRPGDDDDEVVRRYHQAVGPGDSYVGFSIAAGELEPATYRADFALGDVPVARRRFDVKTGRGGD